jgi:hypothetical protein
VAKTIKINRQKPKARTRNPESRSSNNINMKKLVIYSFLMLPLVLLWACKKDKYPGGVVSDYIGIFDIRNMYKGEDVVLTKDNMFGSTKITGVVVSAGCPPVIKNTWYISGYRRCGLQL